MPKLCPNITFPHQQDFSPIRSVTKSSTARFSHENLVEKFKIFVQDFVPIRTALRLRIFVYSIFSSRRSRCWCRVVVILRKYMPCPDVVGKKITTGEASYDRQ